MIDSQLPASICFSDRTFISDEIQLIRELAVDFAQLSLTELACTVCELLEWKRPNGRLKDHECRLFLQQLAAKGLLQLPGMRNTGPKGPRVIKLTESSKIEQEITGTAGQFEPLQLKIITTAQSSESRLWVELIERYHYLGYRVPVGANLRYLVYSAECPEQVLACLMWTSPAWRMAARDRWIGWADKQRRSNLQLIVNNGRFLILPCVRVKGLASKILSRCARQLPDDWKCHYGYRPLLLETLVDTKRFRGTCYRAANWIHLGQTRGRGRMDRANIARGLAVKDLYVYPLCPNVQERLRTAQAPVFLKSAEEDW
jgi:hypothetical protein